MANNDILEMLVEALVIRIKEKLQPEIEQMVADSQSEIYADKIGGLDRYFDGALEEAVRQGNISVDADSVEGLEEYIKSTLKEASVSFDF